MRVQNIKPILIKLRPIGQAIRRLELKYSSPTSDFTGTFDTEGPRKPIYAGTDEGDFLKLLPELSPLVKNLIFQKAHFADLGSGFGRICFAASFVFKKVTGFEIDSQLCEEAEKTRQQFGIRNVTFLNRDFLTADLRPFEVLYFYKPFKRLFPLLMAEKLAETKPGAVVISYLETGPDLFNPDLFRPVYPPNWGSCDEEVSSHFYVVKRR